MHRFSHVLYTATLAATAAVLPFARADRQVIGFVETFALAEDRGEALETLIPGSADYYYYHCLHYQNIGQLERVDPLLSIWRERHRGDARIDIIRNRQAVLLYATAPEVSLDRIRAILQLTWPHQRDRLDPRTRHATRLDPALISRAAFLQMALQHSSDSVRGFEPTAYQWLIGESIGPARRRDLLGRLTRPDYPNLVDHVAADLRWERSTGFGQHPVHGMLTLAQLDILKGHLPALLNNDAYIRAVLRKLRSGAETDVEFDLAARRAWLNRLWDFVRDLPGGQNAIKAHVLYHLLELDRREERIARERFDAYVRLPRFLPYVNEDWIRPMRQRGEVINLGTDYRNATGLPPVGNDEPLVRAILLRLLRDADGFAAYSPYIRESYLREVFAETKLLAGIGDPEQWYSLLSPAQVQALRDRIDIDLAPTNPEIVRPGDPVALAVDVKHVGELMARVYRINALNVYRALGREIDTGLDLDGLEPNHDATFTYREPPIRRVRRILEFPRLREPGVYVIDLIGNGRSSRALLRIGGLTYTMQPGPAGHVFRLYDEAARPVDNGAIHLGPRRYAANADGRIVIPYSTAPGRRDIILEHGERVALDHFDHIAETYALRLGAHVEREALIAHETAHLILRPVLRLNGARMPLGLLEDVRLTLASTDIDGVSSTQVIEPFALDDTAEAVQAFRVPPRLRRLAVTLEARIRPTSGGEPQLLASVQSLAINAIADTSRIAMPLLTRDGTDFILEVRGRNGEPLAGHAVTLQVKHRDFISDRHARLQTDDQGRIALGPLEDIAAITATTAQGAVQRWTLESPTYAYPDTLTTRAGQTLYVPWPATAGALSRASAGMLERRGEQIAADRFETLSLENGYLAIAGLEPGEYQLVLKRDERRIAIHVSAGQAYPGHLVSPVRSLGATARRTMALQPIAIDAETIAIQIANASPEARIHVTATHYAPAFDAFDALHVPGRPDVPVARLPRHGAVYLSGRDIGDEYRYVLDRRTAPRFPGNLLARPGLLLNPWALRETETGEQKAAAGEAFAAQRRAVGRASAAAPAVQRPHIHRPPVGPEALADVDFLAQPALVLPNLRPNADGVVRIDRAALGARGWIRVTAVDGDLTAVAEHALPHQEAPRRERRLVRALDPAGHVVQRRAIIARDTGAALRFDDPTDADLEVYDSLAAVFRLFTTLAAEHDGVDAATLAEFRFLTEWPKLDDATRRERYSRYASHELNFFIYRKDPAFFDTVVRPYLAHKKDKTFLDDYLLGADLGRWRERWRFARLNTFERILLGRRLDDAAAVGRHVADRFALLPPDIEGDNRLFDIALQGGALDADGLAAPFAEALDAVGQARSPVVMRGLYGARSESERSARLAAAPGDARMRPAAPSPVAAPAMDMMLAEAEAFEAPDGLADAVAAREQVRALFEDIAPTREWAENNYYHVPIARQDADRVAVKAFWRDVAAHDPSQPFRSPHFAQASGNLTEMLLVLALLDLPFEPAAHAFVRDGARVDWQAGSPAIVVSRRIESVATVDAERPILVGQNVFKDSERTQRIDNETVDRFITEGFVIDTVYGLRLVLTNPTSTPQRLDLLGQIPEGAIAVGGHRATTGRHVRLDPFESTSVDILFYFPEPGRYAHFPVHVARRDTLVAAAEPIVFDVAAEPPGPDTASWDYISQHGSLDAVIAFLDAHNVEALNLARVAWRLRERTVFDRVIALLDARHAYDNTLWSYGLMHAHLPTIREYLQFIGFADRLGPALDGALLTIDPVLRRHYQFLEYDPLVNARAHTLGAEHRIVNDALRTQYQALLAILAHRPHLDHDDRMAIVYYLLVQDRIADALEHFRQVDPDALATRLQYDAFDVHLAGFTGQYARARAIARRHIEHPVKRWADRFGETLAHLDAIAGTPDPDNITDPDPVERDRRLTRLAATEPALEIDIADGHIEIGYANLDSVRLNLYRMDIELLFSGQPFVQDYGDRFAFVEPSRTERLMLDPDARLHRQPLPDDLRRQNLLVDVQGAGLRRSRVYFSNALDVRLIENYGRLVVAARADDTPQGGVYVKVYARMTDGSVQFHKDGYTDPRGRFDYATVSGPRGSGGITRFSILLLSDHHGATIREAPPPQR